MSNETVNNIMEESMKKSEEYKTEELSKKGFFKRWKKGILDMTIEQQLKNKIIGIIGGMVGLTIALILMVYRKQWGLGTFIFFVIWIQFIGFISTRQQLISTKELMSGLNNKEQDIKSPKIDKELGNLN